MVAEEITWTELIPNIGIGISFIPLVLGLLIYRKADLGIRAIILLGLVSVITDLTTTINNTPQVAVIATRTFSFLEFILVSIFFLSISKRKWLKRTVLVVMCLFPLVVVGDAIMIKFQNLRDDSVTVCESIVFVIYSVVTLYLMMKDMEYQSITSTLHFWILSGLLFYFGGAIFVFSSSNYASTVSMEAFNIVWMIHSILAIIYYSTISIGFWKALKQYQ